MDNNTSKRTALVVASLPSFLTPFMISSVNIALPSIGNEFSLNAILLSWIATSYVLASAIFLVPFGRIADIYGRKRIFTAGMLVYTIAALGCAISTSAPMLISFRIMQGIGGAMVFSNAVAILTSVYPPNERGKALGINVACVYIGLSLGPTLGGFMTQQLGWRSIFFLNVPLGLAIVIIALLKLKGEWAEAKGERFDFAGSVIYCFMLVGIMYGFSNLPALKGIIFVTVGVIGVIMFIAWEIRSKNPVLNMSLFRGSKVFAMSNLAALINYSATSAVAFLLSLYLQYIKSLSPQKAGLVLLAQPIMQAIFSPLAGRMSDKTEPRIVASLGMGLNVAGLFMLVFLRDETALAYIVVSLIFLGFGFALFSSPHTNAVMSSVERRFYGVASGILATMRMLGQMLSMGFVMLIFTLYMGRVKITPEYYSLFIESARTAFIIFAVLCIIGVFASLVRGKVRSK